MNERDFVTKLKDIKSEILALKQAHQYGLGRTDLARHWFHWDTLLESGDNILLKITFADSVNDIPFFQIFNTSLNIEIDSVSFNGHILTITIPYAQYQDIIFYASSPIQSTEMEIV